MLCACVPLYLLSDDSRIFVLPCGFRSVFSFLCLVTHHKDLRRTSKPDESYSLMPFSLGYFLSNAHTHRHKRHHRCLLSVITVPASVGGGAVSLLFPLSQTLPPPLASNVNRPQTVYTYSHALIYTLHITELKHHACPCDSPGPASPGIGFHPPCSCCCPQGMYGSAHTYTHTSPQLAPMLYRRGTFYLQIHIHKHIHNSLLPPA